MYFRKIYIHADEVTENLRNLRLNSNGPKNQIKPIFNFYREISTYKLDENINKYG